MIRACDYKVVCARRGARTANAPGGMGSSPCRCILLKKKVPHIFDFIIFILTVGYFKSRIFSAAHTLLAPTSLSLDAAYIARAHVCSDDLKSLKTRKLLYGHIFAYIDIGQSCQLFLEDVTTRETYYIYTVYRYTYIISEHEQTTEKAFP